MVYQFSTAKSNHCPRKTQKRWHQLFKTEWRPHHIPNAIYPIPKIHSSQVGIPRLYPVNPDHEQLAYAPRKEECKNILLQELKAPTIKVGDYMLNNSMPIIPPQITTHYNNPKPNVHNIDKDMNDPDRDSLNSYRTVKLNITHCSGMPLNKKSQVIPQ